MSTQQYPEWIWQNGVIKRWAEATTHVMSHALHYGSSVFEGIRCYDTPDGPAIFRLTDHNRRLFASARIYDMAIPYTLDELNAACHEVIVRNGLRKAYLRPFAYRGLGGFGLSVGGKKLSEEGEEALGDIANLAAARVDDVDPEGDEESLTEIEEYLRMAVLLCHARQMPEYESIRLNYKTGAFKVATNPGWAKRYPQSAWLIGEEVIAWQKTSWKLAADVR